MSAHAPVPGLARPPRQGCEPQALYQRLPPGPCNHPDDVAASQFERLCGAMAHGVALDGYERLSVRALCALAAVSPKTLYRHFPGGMLECFLGVQERAVTRAGWRVLAAQVQGCDARARLCLAIDAFARLVAEEPETACLVLLEAPCVSVQTREHEQRGMALCALALTESLGGAGATPLAAGIVGGVAHVARALLLEARAEELPMLADRLADWALCCCEQATRVPAGAEEAHQYAEPEPARIDDERSRLMAAAIELVARGELLRLSSETLAGWALVSRRRVDVLFGGARRCVLVAIERGFERALGGSPARAWDDHEQPREQRVLGALLTALARDPALTRAVFTELPALGRDGVRLRESLIGSLATALSGAPPGPPAPAALAQQASAGAVWGAIEHHLAAGRGPQPPTPFELACLLAPPPVAGGLTSDADPTDGGPVDASPAS